MPLAPFSVPLVFDYLHYKHCCCFITAPSCWGWGCIHLFGQTEISFSFSFFFFFSFCTYLACKTGICKQDWAELSPKYPLACNGFKDWQRKVPRTHQKFQIRASAVPPLKFGRDLPEGLQSPDVSCQWENPSWRTLWAELSRRTSY